MLAVSDRFGFRLVVCTASAFPHEVKLVYATFEDSFVKANSKRLIGDKVYDSDLLDEMLKAKGIGLIALYKINRVKSSTQASRVQCIR